MNNEILQFLMKDGISTNIGPNAKEFLLQHAENEYADGNVTSSIFYQTYALYQASQERYSGKIGNVNAAPVDTLLSEMSAVEISEFNDNALMQYVCKSMRQSTTNPTVNDTTSSSATVGSCNFLKDSSNPQEGVNKLIETCQKFPMEWTIIQVCKGPKAATTYAIFPKIHASDAPIYMTIFKHVRSKEYPQPLCLRFSSAEQEKLYESFACIVNRFKQCTTVDAKDVHTHEAKLHYWTLLGELNDFIATACSDLCNFFYPWSFLFTGMSNSDGAQKVARQRWSKVDEFCDLYKWDNDARVLLSLAAAHVSALNVLQINDLCSILTNNCKEQSEVKEMLKNMLLEKADHDEQTTNHYPCILVVDERLDHFFWEELNVQQEFTRISSIQSLWRLFLHYKANIKQGYLCVNITDGGCVLNPDKNLPKMEARMVSFFKHWTPHWEMLVGQRPTQDELFNKYLSHTCYVYAGHGSGLQYINGRKIAKHQMNCVVFLFGCDSSRLYSSGLYSELVGSHLYYQAAMCPALVGTLMPGLDCNMDKIATEVLSRWIVPKSTNILPWSEIDEKTWVKEFIIKPKVCKKTKKTPVPSVANTPNYNMASLCGVLSRVHQRACEHRLYNTVPYVCRGLPVWNCDVEPVPTNYT